MRIKKRFNGQWSSLSQYHLPTWLIFQLKVQVQVALLLALLELQYYHLVPKPELQPSERESNVMILHEKLGQEVENSNDDEEGVEASRGPAQFTATSQGLQMDS